MTTLREEPADRELVRRAKAGDPGAFDQIWRLYWTPVYVTALSVLHHDKDAANDAAAEVFAGLLGGGLSGFDESRPLLPLLRTIATRRAADEVRRRSRRVSVSYTAEVPDVPTDDLVSDGVVSEEHGLALFWALAQMLANDDERRLFPLWVLETAGRMTRAEVADALGWPLGATATRVHRLRKSLKHAGMAISLVNNGDRTCAEFTALAPVAGELPGEWQPLVTHVRSCADCGPQGERLFRADRMLPAIAAAVVGAAEVARSNADVRTAAALTPVDGVCPPDGGSTEALAPQPPGEVDAPTEVFDPATPAGPLSPGVARVEVLGPVPAQASSGGVGSAISKKLMIAGAVGVAVITGLVLLTPGVVMPPREPTLPGDARQTLSSAPPGSSDTSTPPVAPPGSSVAGVPPGGTPAPTAGRPTANIPGNPDPGNPGQGAPLAEPTWAHWQVRWADEPGTRDLGPSPQHNGNEESNWTAGDWTAGRKARVTRTGTGRYVVVLPEVGAPGGLVHVTANDLQVAGSTCQPVRWQQQGADEAVEVACFSRAGAPADVPFTGLFVVGPNRLPVTRTGVGTYRLDPVPVLQLTPVGEALRRCSGTQTVTCTDATGAPADADLVATGASTTTLVPGHPHGANLRYGTAIEHQWPGNATVERTGPGRYTVRAPVGWLPSYTHVTGTGPGYCTLVSRNDIGQNNTVLGIACFTPAGAPADGGFHVSYTTTSAYAR